MVTKSGKNLVPKFFGNTANTYDKVARCATLGKDEFWKKEILKKISNGQVFLDLACGTGILTRKIAQKFPNSRVIGIDITESYLIIAKRNSSSFKNISYLHQDAERLNLDVKFDAIISSYIPKYCDPEILVKICVDHLNPKGRIIFHDFTYPKNKLIQNIWKTHFVVLQSIGNFVPSWKEAFTELPKLIRTSEWLKNYENAMIKNGLEIKHNFYSWGTSAILTGTKFSKS
jgi:demethylmenaquinone methyltransferase / 2-methoxy-6-polyprenyl-1,4-benzoquinol methylase